MSGRRVVVDGGGGNGPARYSVELVGAFPDVCARAKRGVQSCQAIAAFVHDRAQIESTYGRALVRLAQQAKAEKTDWAPQLAASWARVQEALETVAKEHAECGSRLQGSMAPGVKAFAAQQEIQVQRLITEGTKFRTAQQNMLTAMDRAKEKYDRRCADALELTTTLRRSESMDQLSTSPMLAAAGTTTTTGGPATSASAATTVPAMQPLTTVTVAETAGDEPKETVGQLLNKVWDTTSSFTKPSIERQRSRLEASLEELFAAEKHYVQAVEYVNAQRPVVEREITENLHAFQLTEEQRMEYLKDVLTRMTKAMVKALETTETVVMTLKEVTNSINEIDDIEQGFRQLNNEISSNDQLLDPASNLFYDRMAQVEDMSERGRHMVQTMSSTVADLIAIEDSFVTSIQRLLRAHDTTTANTNNDMFSLTSSLHQVSEEGTSMLAGWKAVKDHIHKQAEVHKEFRSLLAEPVALSLSTMKLEYENARSATHESFSKSHGLLCQDNGLYQKLKQKLESKSREFAGLFASLPEMGGTDLSNVDIDQALALLQQLSGSFSDKDKKIEAKVRLLAEDVRDVRTRFIDSETAYKQRSSIYMQDVDVFISVYMKNEKYRLQVEKSSLQSLTKALDHRILGEMAVARIAVDRLDAINSTADVIEFIAAHQKRHEKTHKVSPALHDNDVLRLAIEEYYRNRAISPVKPSSSHASTNQGSPLKRAVSVVSPPLIPINADGDPKVVLEEEKEIQPLGSSDFQKKFQLEAPEQVVESYSCALYANNFPNHGRLYLTRDHLCFNGWRDTIYVLSYNDITTMEKKNSALIVPNAIEITASNGEKAFFTSFVFRDECFQCIQQLQAIKRATAAAMVGDQPILGLTSDSPTSTNAEPLSEDSQGPPLHSPSMSTTPSKVLSSCNGPVPLRMQQVPARDAVLDEFEIVLDDKLPFSVDFAHAHLWIESADFFQAFLVAGGETNIVISNWSSEVPVSYTAVNSSDTFDGSRVVTYNHNKKYMVGPSCIPTQQTQRYRWSPSSQLVLSITSTVTDAPYCDYFRAENRWVFGATSNENTCTLQVGIKIQWVKSTWLKKQIESTAMGEAKDYTRALVTAAIAESKKHIGAASVVPLKNISAEVLLTEADSQTPGSATSSSSATLSIDVSKQKSNSILLDAEGTTPQSQSSHSGSPPVHQLVGGTQTLVQFANVFCIVLFIYTMYRICATLEQMSAFTIESIRQQQQQQELLEGILHEMRRKTGA